MTSLVYLVDNISHTSIPLRALEAMDSLKHKKIVYCFRKYNKTMVLNPGTHYFFAWDVFRLINFLRTSQKVIFHAHHLKSILVFFLMRAVFMFNTYFIITIHSNYSRYTFLQKLMFAPAIAMSNVCIANSISTSKSLPRILRKLTKNYIVYNGVEFGTLDGESIKDRMNNLNTLNNLRIGIVGRLEKIKNIDHSLKFAAELRKFGIDFSIEIVGDGCEKQNIIALAEKLDLSRLCRFRGAIPHRDLLHSYTEYDIVLVLSSYEGFCNVAAEAAGYGCLLILHDIEVFRELYEDDEAIFVSSLDAATIAKNFISKRSSIDLKAVAQRARQRLQHERFIEEHLSIYDNLFT